MHVTVFGPAGKIGRLVVAAMDATGVRRFTGLATPSLADPRDARHWKHAVLPVVAGLAFPNALTELRGMTDAVTSTGLDYTIARITSPTDKPATGRVRSGFPGHASRPESRAVTSGNFSTRPEGDPPSNSAS